MIQINLRIDDNLHSELKMVAKEEKRSVNSQILHYVENGLFNREINNEKIREIIGETRSAKNERN